MKLSEFKAWLDGFTDAMGDAPTPEQWAKIKAKLAQVQDFSGILSPNNGPMRPYWETPVIGRAMLTGDPVIRPGTVVCGDPPGSIGNMGVSNAGGVQ